MTKNEQRASQRFQAKAGSYITYVDGARAIRDLSMDGIFIMDTKPVAAGATIKFVVLLGNETVMFKGIVKRCVLQEGMGIQFQDVSRDLRRRLLSYAACIGKEDVPASVPKRAASAGYSREHLAMVA